jgi:hypothetical protein
MTRQPAAKKAPVAIEGENLSPFVSGLDEAFNTSIPLPKPAIGPFRRHLEPRAERP